jgi:hypothetical protein
MMPLVIFQQLPPGGISLAQSLYQIFFGGGELVRNVLNIKNRYAVTSIDLHFSNLSRVTQAGVIT